MKFKFTILSFILSITVTNSFVFAQAKLKGHIAISGAFALYPLAVKWAEEFKKLNPGVNIDISAGGAGKGMTDALTGAADIGMISRDINPVETKKGAIAIAVAKDAVLPTISASNPLLNELLKRGIKYSGLSSLWATGKSKTWSQATGIKSGIKLHVYTRSDASGAGETWAKYFKINQEDLFGVGVFGDPGVANAVKKDAIGIGYNNIVYVYDMKTHRQTYGVRVLPIDFNNNGKIDADENFYDTLDELTVAISSGKYPSPPARDLYFVTKGKSFNPIVKAFLSYCLNAGQKYVHESGYINLSKEQLLVEINKTK